MAGDSVAFGTGIGDEDTIASQLQRRDLTRQYITIAIPGAAASDVVCALEKASKRYHGQIDGLVYVYSHTDFDETAKYGQPDQFLEWVKGFAERENIVEVTIVLTANIYNIVPHLTRPVVVKDDDNNDWHKEARAMREEAEAAGFRFVSIAELALEEADRRRTDFGAFALFLDGGGHLSPYGTMRLVETIRSAPAHRGAN